MLAMGGAPFVAARRRAGVAVVRRAVARQTRTAAGSAATALRASILLRGSASQPERTGPAAVAVHHPSGACYLDRDRRQRRGCRPGRARRGACRARDRPPAGAAMRNWARSRAQWWVSNARSMRPYVAEHRRAYPLTATASPDSSPPERRPPLVQFHLPRRGLSVERCDCWSGPTRRALLGGRAAP
jgi:hypothetical protein